jgi:hypothetical protein
MVDRLEKLVLKNRPKRDVPVARTAGKITRLFDQMQIG